MKGKNSLPATLEPFVDIEAVAKHLDVAVGTIEHWRSQGKKIPCHPANRKTIRYLLSEVDEWFRAGAK